MKLDAITSLLPDKGTKSATLNAVYKQSGVHTRAALDVFKVSCVTARSCGIRLSARSHHAGPDRHR